MSLITAPRLRVLSLLAIVIAPVATPAQEADTAEVQLTEVVISSQKRASGVSNQRVPSAISAFDAESLEEAFTVTLTDVGRLTPNVQLNQVSTFNGYSNFYIRGIGINGSTRTVDPAVGLFVDGVYVGFGPSSLVDTFELASVEILRGPQGTLFGRNVSGGAVSVTTKRPSQAFEAETRVGFGSFDRADFAAMVNVPLADTVAARVAALYQHSDGYFDNLENGKTKASKNLTLVRPSIRFELSERLDVTLITEFLKNNGGPATSQNIVNPVAPKLAQTRFGYIPPADKYDVRHDLQGYSDSEVKQAIVESNFDLGHGLITGVLGWRDVQFDSSTDFDGSPMTLFHFPDNQEKQDQRSIELRYASKHSDRYDYTIGLYYFEQDFFIGEQRDTFSPALGAPVRTIGRTDQEQDNSAVFAQGNYRFTDQWSATLGGRYTREKKSIAFVPPGVARCTPDFASCTFAALVGERDWSNFSPKVGLEWTPRQDLLTYVSWTNGFRSGVYNARAQIAAALGPAEPEEVASLELGVKSQFFDRRLRVNAALFTMDYDDIQKIINDTCDPDGAGPLPPTSCQVTRNAAKATVEGVELEASALLGSHWTLDAAVGYTDAKYDEFTGQDVNGDGIADPALARELAFEKVPELTYFVGLGYRRPLAGGSSFGARASWSYTDSFFTDTLNRWWLKQAGYGLIDASVTYDRGNWQLAAYGKNLTDEEYIDFAADVGVLGSWVFGGEPRRYGAEFRYRF